MKTILVVEDSEDDVFFLRRALRSAEIYNSLHVARDGQQAMDYLMGKGGFGARNYYPIPDLILLDLKLPYIMGLDVLKWIREQEQFGKIPVVVLTSSQEESDVALAYRLGGNSYLVKPPTPEKLLDMIHKIGETWRQPFPED